jgi:hypothetical protein
MVRRNYPDKIDKLVGLKQKFLVIFHLQMVDHPSFLIKAAFQVTNRHFFVLGELLSGKIRKGMTVDLSNAGIPGKFAIEAIEFALNREDGKVWEDIGLGISGLSDDEKQLLKQGIPFPISVFIEEQ